MKSKDNKTQKQMIKEVRKASREFFAKGAEVFITLLPEFLKRIKQ